MRVLLTSAGLETEEIKKYFMDMTGKDMSVVKALFIPTAAIHSIYLKESMPQDLINPCWRISMTMAW